MIFFFSLFSQTPMKHSQRWFCTSNRKQWGLRNLILNLGNTEPRLTITVLLKEYEHPLSSCSMYFNSTAEECMYVNKRTCSMDSPDLQGSSVMWDKRAVTHWSALQFNLWCHRVYSFKIGKIMNPTALQFTVIPSMWLFPLGNVVHTSIYKIVISEACRNFLTSRICPLHYLISQWLCWSIPASVRWKDSGVTAKAF